MSFQLPLLPESYSVGPNDVIIGRGKKCTQNPGNKRFRSIIQETLDSYQNAETKVKKSEIIMQVLSQVREDDGAGFVKIDSASGRYIQVEEASCRIAIAQAFRDALSGAYKSSKKHKQMRRLERKRASAENLQGLAGMHQAPQAHGRSIFEEAGYLPGLQEHKVPNVRPTAAGISMFQLRDILQEATNVSAFGEGHSDASLAVAAFQNSQNLGGLPGLNNDVFANLLMQQQQQQMQMQMAAAQMQGQDPFEPTPLQIAGLPFFSHDSSRAA
jgi:hypothetical protein